MGTLETAACFRMSIWRRGCRRSIPFGLIRRIADAVLAGMSGRFAAAYAPIGRPSIAPEKLLRALLLQALYTIRSERQLVERIDFDLLFRWFVGLGIDDAVWDASTFAKNRDRFLEMDAAAELLAGVVNHPDVRRQMSRDHFSVDGTLIDAWASMKSFKPKDDPGATMTGPAAMPSGIFTAEALQRDACVDHGPRRPALQEGGWPAEPAVLRRHRVDGEPQRPRGRWPPDAGVGCLGVPAAIDLADEHISRGGTLAGDKGFDTADFVAELRERRITPHVAQNAYDTGKAKRRSNIDGRTTRHAGYAASQKCRKRIEEIFGWLKTVGAWRKSRFRGLDRTAHGFHLALAAYNLARMPKLLVAEAVAMSRSLIRRLAY